MANLVGAHQGIVDAANDVRNAIGGVQALVRIHLARIVGVGRDLPTTKVDRVQTGLHLLYCLVAGERTESRHVRFVMQQPPESLRAKTCQGMLDLNRAPQFGDVLGAVRAFDAFPAGIRVPLLFWGVLSVHV